MAIIRRLAILGAAGAGVAWFLKQRQETGDGGGFESPLSGREEEVGDAAAAGTGTAEAASEEPASTPAVEAPAQATSVSHTVEPPAQETTVSQTVEPPGDAVMPDTAADPGVREQEEAASAEAGAIGGTPETPQGTQGLGEDPAMRPVVEAGGEEHETLEATDDDLGAGRERHS